jgi:hypothetical protein
LKAIFLIFLLFVLACNRSSKLSDHFHEQNILWGAYEVVVVSDQANSKHSSLPIVTFKSLQIEGKQFAHVSGCLLAELIEGRYRLSWKLFSDPSTCQSSTSILRSFNELKGYDLELGSELFNNINVSIIKLTLRSADTTTKTPVIKKYYLPNLTSSAVWPVRQREIFQSPFLKSAVPGVQFELIATAPGGAALADLINVSKYLPSSLNQEWVKCAEWDNGCRPVQNDDCHLCQHGHTNMMYGECATKGVRFCGAVRCGSKGQVPCHLGRTQIENEDFKGCSELSEEWLCAPGLMLDCTARPYPLCR